MADIANPGLQSLFHSLDPISMILSQNSSPSNPIPLRLTTESYIMERGPRYSAYAELREAKLRRKIRKHKQEIEEEEEEKEIEFKQTPTKKQVKFSSNSIGVSRKGSSSVLAQSVPDFSATLRKENRKPPPQGKNWSKGNNGVLSNLKGSKSVNSEGEKKGGRLMMMARKSYANVEELKGFSIAAANAINGENRAGKSSSRGYASNNKTVLGYRQF